MNKRERISQWLAEATGEDVNPDQADVERHPYYRAFFRCWNEQRYYEAHDVLEQLWLNTKSPDADYFKGLIQAAGAFVHLQKHFEHPLHAKHSRRLSPAVRLFRLAQKNLANFAPLASWLGCRRILSAIAPIRRSRSSHPITRPIPGHRKPRRSCNYDKVGAVHPNRPGD